MSRNAGVLGCRVAAAPLLALAAMSQGCLPAAGAAAVTARDAAAEEAQLAALVNQARATAQTCGGQAAPAAATLGWSSGLADVAYGHSADMVARGFFDHANPEGQMVWDRLDSSGYQWTGSGEDLAMGMSDPGQVVAAWLASADHCVVLMDARYDVIGIGHVVSATGVDYWTADFVQTPAPAPAAPPPSVGGAHVTADEGIVTVVAGSGTSTQSTPRGTVGGVESLDVEVASNAGRAATVNWTALSGATKYQVRISKPGSAKFTGWKTVKSLSRNFKKLARGKAYSVQVRAIFGKARGPASEVRFTAM